MFSYPQEQGDLEPVSVVTEGQQCFLIPHTVCELTCMHMPTSGMDTIQGCQFLTYLTFSHGCTCTIGWKAQTIEPSTNLLWASLLFFFQHTVPKLPLHTHIYGWHRKGQRSEWISISKLLIDSFMTQECVTYICVESFRATQAAHTDKDKEVGVLGSPETGWDSWVPWGVEGIIESLTSNNSNRISFLPTGW